MNRAYCRCNSGHYFVGEYCPLDGWSSPESIEVKQLTEQIVTSGSEPHGVFIGPGLQICNSHSPRFWAANATAKLNFRQRKTLAWMRS